MTSIFDGIEDARPSFVSNYFRPGRYIVRIDKVKQGTAVLKGPFIAVETTVLAVLEASEASNRVGDSPTAMMMQRFPSFLGNVKSFVAAVCECSPDEVTKEECERLVLDDGTENAQPLSGVVAEVIVVERLSREKKTELHIPRWVRPITEAELPTLVDAATLDKYMRPKTERGGDEVPF